ncbi:hypothetical protein DW251_14530 [Clostridium sp. AM22-11AC]|nr:hypothetical protein DW251_14530 [Clostridium sp. AM22-11AC]
MFILSNRYLRQIKLCLGYFLKLKYFFKNGTFFVTCDKNRDKENDTINTTREEVIVRQLNIYY